MPQPNPAEGTTPRDHGGNLDAAIARFGGTYEDWLDLSTGINPVPYPIPSLPEKIWTDLPDRGLLDRALSAARKAWHVPDTAQIAAAPGASALIARLPGLRPTGRVAIEPPTYNEHAAAFLAAGWKVVERGPAEARVLVHPNNPDGRVYGHNDIMGDLTIIDESFCDIAPDQSLVAEASKPGVIVLKSFGKFWGLAGLRLGFAIADPVTTQHLAEMLGPWPVSGPALHIGTMALKDSAWAISTRTRLEQDRIRLDQIMEQAGAQVVGGTDLFGLYRVPDAEEWQNRLGQAHVWSRIFPYANDLLRLGLPPADRWMQLEHAV